MEATPCPYASVDLAIVAAVKARSTGIVTWPIDGERRANELTGWGVDGIGGDDLELLRRVVRGVAVPSPGFWRSAAGSCLQAAHWGECAGPDGPVSSRATA